LWPKTNKWLVKEVRSPFVDKYYLFIDFCWFSCNHSLLLYPESKLMIQKAARNKFFSALIQILVWLAFGIMVFVYQPLTLGFTMPAQFWVNQAVIFSLLVSVYYFNARVLVPRFLLKNRIGQYIFAIIAVTAATVFFGWVAGQVLHMQEIMQKGFSHKPQQPHKNNFYRFEFLMSIIIAFILAISTSIASTQNWQKNLQQRQAMEQDKISSELAFLKTQINPHFFFNTLNNIYALTIINVENSRVALHQLSRMMRYLLYETQQDATLLSKEVAFVKDYISLMELRLTELTKVVFETPTINQEATMAPMLLLPFIENAFKHGISATKPSCIVIRIEQQDNILLLQVKNPVFKEQLAMADEYSGIGLQNTVRRLDLLYPEKYMLSIDNNTENQEYSINLKIQLT
jgi:two-component system LytT family sensor kinase